MNSETATNPQRILVLGATGLIGNAIARTLSSRGHQVTASCRARETPVNLAELSLDVAQGDLDSPGLLEELIPAHEVVIDAAAPYPLNLVHTPPGRRKPTIAYAAERSERLAGLVRTANSKLVVISTLLAASPPTAAGFTGLQQRFMRIAHPYFAIKRTIERTLLQANPPLPGLLIVRPPACMGPWDVKPREYCLVPKLVAGEVKVAMSQSMNLIDTRDVAEIVAAAIEADRYDETLELYGHNTSVGALLDEISRQSGTAAPRWRFPASFAVLPSWWAEFAWASIGRASPLPALLPVLVSEQRWAGASGAPTLGIMPRPLAETVSDTLSWYRRLGYC